MLKVIDIFPSGQWPAATACDRITLDYDARHRRRFRYVGDAGVEFLLDLPRAVVLKDGDGLRLNDGRMVAVGAAAEALVEVTAANPTALVQLAWHIGNRHLPAQLEEHRILIRQDHVIEAMLIGLGATIRSLLAPFTPESGAYASAHTHGAQSHEFVFTAAHGHEH